MLLCYECHAGSAGVIPHSILMGFAPVWSYTSFNYISHILKAVRVLTIHVQLRGQRPFYDIKLLQLVFFWMSDEKNWWSF